MKPRFTLISLALAAVLAAPAFGVTSSRSYENPRVTQGAFPIRRACMMPAEGKLTKIGMKGSEGMTKEAEEWNAALQNLVEGHLKSAGIELQSAANAGTSSASDDEIRQVILQLEQKYNEISTQINRHPKDIAKSRFTLGDEVSLLPCAATSDVVVFVRGEGQTVTEGKSDHDIPRRRRAAISRPGSYYGGRQDRRDSGLCPPLSCRAFWGKIHSRCG